MNEELEGIFAGRIGYRVCPRCGRAVPKHSRERYCINDGSRLLEKCPRCKANISSPYTRFCGECGLELVAG